MPTNIEGFAQGWARADKRGPAMPRITYAYAPLLLATASMAVSPLAAAEMPLATAPSPFAEMTAGQQIEQGQTAEHRRYHRHRHHRYRYRRGPGIGDVLAGVLIIGAISHAARAATRDDRRERDRDYRRDERRSDTRGIDRAVEMCVEAIETQQRVEAVERVDRTARGWQVEGRISSGDGFLCRLGPDGRIETLDFSGRRDVDDDRGDNDDRWEDIDYDEDRRERDEDDGQWDDDRYDSEWSRVDRDARVQAGEREPVDDAPIDGDLADAEVQDWPGEGA